MLDEVIKMSEMNYTTFVVLAGLGMSLIQISPLEINPWDAVLDWLGSKLNRTTEARLSDLERQLESVWVSSHRQRVLAFARECRSGMNHSVDEWANVLNCAEEYEQYVEKKHIANGIITQDTEYIRQLYQDISHKRKI